MKESTRELLKKAIKFYDDGTTFYIDGMNYLVISKTVIECIDTGKRYFLGLDF